jgi:hypothetical protein
MHDSKRIKITDNLYITTSTSDNTKELINKKPYVYENFIVNEHNRKINIFNNFVDSLDVNIIKQNEIKTFCGGLQDNNDTHLIIKYIIAKNTHDFTLTLSEILNNDLTDFTICFSDGVKIQCLKPLLKLIPYFLIIFGDFDEFKTDMELNIKSDIASIVLKLLYKQDISQLIIVENFCEIIKLMDLWLMEIYVGPILKYMANSASDIISYLIQGEKYDDILMLEDKFNSWFETKIYGYDYGDKIFIFNNWQLKFSDDIKMKAIQISKKYELFNVAAIDPFKVLLFLITLDPSKTLDIVLRMKRATNSKVFYKEVGDCNNNLNSPDHPKMVAVIDEYYPIFKVKIYTKTCIRFDDGCYEVTNRKDIFSITHNFMDIYVGRKILIGDNFNLMYEKYNCVTIETITYDLDNNIQYETLPVCVENITVNGLSKKDVGYVWTINEINHKICITQQTINKY